MSILEQSIQISGGVSKLAEAIDVRPNVITNWRTRGVPKGWAAVLHIKYARKAKRKAKSDVAKDEASE